MNQGHSDTFPSDVTSIKGEIDTYLLSYCRSERDKALRLHPDYGRLWDAIIAHVENGGKRLRPYLVVMAYEAFGGKDANGIIRVASAWELIHVAMLMHDDIIDRDYVRHGHPNVAGTYLRYYTSVPNETDRRHFANSGALLAGDLLISASYELLYGSDFPAEDVHGISTLLHEAIFTVVGGELLEVEAVALHTDISPRLIAEAKTASYSLIGPLLTGALLAGASESVQGQLRELGRILGVGFQYVDDMLGVFGDPAVTGKSATSDLEEGKRTFVISEALKLMNEADHLRTDYLLDHPSPEVVDELRGLIEKTEVRDTIAERIDGLQTQALELVAHLDISKQHRKSFEQVVFMMLKREA